MIDLHTHILPEIDDGADSFEQSLDMARIAIQEGIEIMAATYHLLDLKNMDSLLKKVQEQKKELEAQLRQHNIDLEIITGAEVYISPILMDKKDFSGISINGSRYLLMELPMGDIPNYTEDVIYRLRLRGVVPVIAHPERNIRIQEDPNRYYELVDLGALGQVNTGSICGRFGSRVQKCAHILIEHNLVHVLGTDAHSSGTRSPRMREAIRLISKLFGKEQATQMAVHRPQAIIEDRILEGLLEPEKYKKPNPLFFWKK